MSLDAGRARAVAILLGLSLAVPVAAQIQIPAAPAPRVQAAAVPSTIRIDNFDRVNENHFRGAQPKGQDFADLASLGVKMVIDLAKEGDRMEQANAAHEGMTFVRIPLTTGVAPSQAAVDQFLSLVNDPANQPVYVHCMGGKHRTGTLTAMYRMTEDGWTADQAFREMKQFKFGADFLHPELKAFVYSSYSRLAGAARVGNRR